jgi:hypothetical protein
MKIPKSKLNRSIAVHLLLVYAGKTLSAEGLKLEAYRPAAELLHLDGWRLLIRGTATIRNSNTRAPSIQHRLRGKEAKMRRYRYNRIFSPQMHNTYICNIVIHIQLKCVDQEAADAGTNTQNGDGYNSYYYGFSMKSRCTATSS